MKRISVQIKEEAAETLKDIAKELERTPHWLHCKILEEYAKDNAKKAEEPAKE